MSDAASTEQFAFDFDGRFRRPLSLVGVRAETAGVEVTDADVTVRFGPWRCTTRIDNVREVCITRDYEAYRAIGPRLSFKDRGVTFGTNTHMGVCLLLRTPVRGLDPLGLLRHPGITVTVRDPERFAATLRERAGL
jgi:hypothetical protein